MTTQSRLFSDYQLGGLALKNRIVISPMCQYSAADDACARPWHLMHYGNAAISGAALVIVEATAVERVGRITRNCLGLYDDGQEAALRRLVADIRTFSSTPLGIQLNHAGRKGSVRPSWQGRGLLSPDERWTTIAPSSIPIGDGWSPPDTLDASGMRRVIDAFVDSTRRAERCGFDLVELHSAHGYLLHSFLSPLSNVRDDHYGGSLENRMRFSLEVVTAVRNAWPCTKPLGVRINGTDWHPDGFQLDDAAVYAARLKSVGVDYVTVSAGGAGLAGVSVPPIVPGYMVEYAEFVRRKTELRTIAVGMILHPEQAEDIIAAGRADLVALARGYLDDPRWGWHAGNRRGQCEAHYPNPYSAAQPDRWAGYLAVHGNCSDS